MRCKLCPQDIIISIQPEGRFWQEPEPSQATGMALAHCILGSFLGVGNNNKLTKTLHLRDKIGPHYAKN